MVEGLTTTDRDTQVELGIAYFPTKKQQNHQTDGKPEYFVPTYLSTEHYVYTIAQIAVHSDAEQSTTGLPTCRRPPLMPL